MTTTRRRRSSKTPSRRPTTAPRTTGQQPRAGLHVVFIGGFATLALAVSTQVTLGHRGYRSVMLGKPWQVVAIGGL